MMRLALVGLAALLLLVPMVAAAPGGHYIPQAGDRFDYSETTFLTNGYGNYSGYTESAFYNGSIAVTATLPNGTESAVYQSGGTWSNNQGQSGPWSENGSFTFSANTYHYVQGTDNQTGYVDPLVWFYMNNTLSRGSSFSLLNTEMDVVSTSFAFPLASSSTGYVTTIFAEGNGTYQRDDSYGIFTASYQWKGYFDPATGYVVGYEYIETDSNSANDGFTWTDMLTDTQTSFPLTPAAVPAASAAAFPWVLVFTVVGVVALIAIILVVVILLVGRSRRRLPRHPTVSVPGTLPSYAPPTPIHLIPGDQPPVEQIVLKETVKVPCRYCGTLIDSTATNCPKCGAPRT